MREDRSITTYDKFIYSVLLISGATTLLIGCFILFRIIFVILEDGLYIIAKLELLQLSTLCASVIAIPVGVISIYLSYVLMKGNLVSKYIFYFCSIQGLILLYPLFSAYANPDIIIMEGTITEKTLISSISMFGVILLFHTLYIFVYEDKL